MIGHSLRTSSLKTVKTAVNAHLNFDAHNVDREKTFRLRSDCRLGSRLATFLCQQLDVKVIHTSDGIFGMMAAIGRSSLSAKYHFLACNGI